MSTKQLAPLAILLMATLHCLAQANNKPSEPAEEKPNPFTIYVVGDESAGGGEQGWVSHLSRFFVAEFVHIADRSLPESSAEAYLASNVWKKTQAEMKPHDYVFIQLGRHEEAGAGSAYRLQHDLETLVQAVKGAGAVPVLLTPNAINLWKDGKLSDSNSEAKTSFSVAQTQTIGLGDAAEVERGVLEGLGQTNAADYFTSDPERTNAKGADLFASCIMEALRRAKSPLTEQNPFLSYATFKTMTPITTMALTNVNWEINQERLTSAAKDIAFGSREYQIEKTNGRGTQVKLPIQMKYLSEDGEVGVWKSGTDKWVLFFTFKGVLDSFAGFMYSTNGKIPPADAFLGNPIEIIKMAPNWYWYSSQN
jgi:hypothetical protein